MALGSIAVAVGIVGVVAFVKRMLWRRRFGHGFGGHPHFAFAGACHGEHGDGPGFGFRGPGRSFWLRGLFSRLDTTPGQEREIRAAIEDFQRTTHEAKEGIGGSREDVARAVAGEIFDEDAASQAAARIDASLGRAKEAFAVALRRIHGVLDPKQRERLSELLAKGPRFGFRRWGGPYRGGAEL